MCGFVGYYSFNAFGLTNCHAIVAKMAAKIKNRGPDSYGCWHDQQASFVVGHQRLAIVDLSAKGHQPMMSQSCRYVISYNGEIYNTADITQELQSNGIQLKSHSDTEVLLEACAIWGVEKTISKLNGMFAFALWDIQEKQLYLVRDRMGIKPLYWGFNNDILFFGSQLNAFGGHPQWKPELNRAALSNYFSYSYVPAPQSIYNNIFKLKPGHFVVIDRHRNVRMHQYWDLKQAIKTEQQKIIITQDDIIELLSDSVKRRMVADVPLGAFLSGGIDSSTVVALMQAQSTNRINTFSIGFHEKQYDEALYAKAVAEHLGTEHHELYVSMNDAAAIVPEISNYYDEPFADSSQLPTYMVSKLAKQYVTVSLSGDGGDELFAGYNRYWAANKMLKPISCVPFFMRRFIAGAITSVPEKSWESIAGIIPNAPRGLGNKAHKFAKILKASSSAFYQSLVTTDAGSEPWVLGQTPSFIDVDMADIECFITRMQAMDSVTYLPDDILTKVDRASMACSLEARVPLLDHRLVEMAFSMPLSQKIYKGQTKYPLREVLYRYVPKKIMDRPKMGFGVPIGQWLCGSLREWAEELIDPIKMKQNGILNVEKVQEYWKQHLSGQLNHQYELWNVLMFQAWQQQSSQCIE